MGQENDTRVPAACARVAPAEISGVAAVTTPVMTIVP